MISNLPPRLDRAYKSAASLFGTHEDTAPEAAPTELPTDHPLLVEGIYNDDILSVAMPNGEVWKYTLPLEAQDLFRRVVMVCIHHRDHQFAACFRPSAEGIHPFVGVAARFGVERSQA